MLVLNDYAVQFNNTDLVKRFKVHTQSCSFLAFVNYIVIQIFPREPEFDAANIETNFQFGRHNC